LISSFPLTPVTAPRTLFTKLGLLAQARSGHDEAETPLKEYSDAVILISRSYPPFVEK
jgi:hypothetical protein